jgi:DNA repair protein RadA/Sms
VGEIGLGGEIRTVGQIDKRIQEAVKLGFKRIVIPQNNVKSIKVQGGIEILPVDRVEKAIEALL